MPNNRDIKNAYLQRIIERQDLAIAEDKFTPNFTPSVELVYNRNQLGAIAANQGNLNLGANLVGKIPTGAEISATWAADRQAQNTLGSSTITNDLRAGISLSRTFGDRHLESQVERSQIQLEIEQNNLEEQRENLEISVINSLRDVEFTLKQVEQAQRARELSEQQLKNEREKLRLGVGNTRLTLD